MIQLRNVVASFAIGLVIGAPLGVLAKTGVFVGKVVHISTNNIKVRDSGGQELSFLIVPRFHKIFHADGKTTAQMNEIKAGDTVKVYYDQSALGARHADQIIDATAPIKPLKS